MLFKNYNQIICNGENSEIKKQRKDILDILDSAIKEVDPYKLVKNIFKEEKILIEGKNIDANEFNNIYLISFGKASIRMAKAVLD